MRYRSMRQQPNDKKKTERNLEVNINEGLDGVQRIEKNVPNVQKNQPKIQNRDK